MNTGRKKCIIISSILILIAMFACSFAFFVANKKNVTSGQLTKISHANVTSPVADGTYSLPMTIKDLAPGTPVKVSFTIANKPGMSLYFISVYCPLQIYANGHLIYEFGHHDSYPSYFSDPPYAVDSCFLPTNSDSPVTNIVMVYTFPNERNAIAINQPVIGNAKSIMHMLFLKSGPSFAISIVDMLFGSILIFMSVLGAILDLHNDSSIIWLGLFAFISGTWIFTSNVLTTYMSGSPSLLYVTSYIAFYLIPIPLVMFGADMLDLRQNILVRVMLAILLVFFTVSLGLQFSGIVPFLKSVYLFHLLAVLSISSITYLATRYSVHRENKYVRFFHVPFVVFETCVLAEVFNYYIRFFSELSVLFGIGLNLFLILAIIDTGLFMASSIRSARSSEEMNNSLLFLRKQVEVERNMYDHTNGSFSNSGYYTELAAGNNVRADIRVDALKDIPAENLHDVNILVDNLILTAIASCCQLPPQQRYVRMHLIVNGHIASITLDYSINPENTVKSSDFFTKNTNDYASVYNAVNKTVEAHNGELHYSVLNGLNNISILLNV